MGLASRGTPDLYVGVTNHSNIAARICLTPVWDKVKLSENLGETAVVPVAPVIASLNILN